MANVPERKKGWRRGPKGPHGRSWVLVPALSLLVVSISALNGCGIRIDAGDEVPPPVRMGGDLLLWGPEIKGQAVSMIDRSTGFCHLEMYELSDLDILDALARAKSRSVDVRVILDATEPHSLSVAVPFLKRAGILFRLERIPGGISHIKLLSTETRDGSEAMLGGMNFGEWSFENHDASVFFSRAGTGFEGLFQQDYARAGGEPGPPAGFSPPLLYDRQIEPAMLQAVSRARRDIVVDAFAFTSRDLLQALAASAARGVKVRVLLDRRQPYNRRTARELAAFGASVRYYTPYQGEDLHAKILCVDGGKAVFVGSANFSYHGFAVNHEGDVELFNAWPFGKAIERDAENQFLRGRPL